MRPEPACPQTALPDRVFLIGNPVSGRGRGAAALAAAGEALRMRGLSVEVRSTEAPGHAVELAREAAREADLILVIGGDGTVRDVVQGLAGADVPLGILPGGTGNDLARTLGIPRDLNAALEAALVGRDRPLDVWLWDQVPFVNVAGVGLDAAVAGTVNRKLRMLHGAPAYAAAFCMTLPGFRPQVLRLSWPGGGWSGEAWLAAFANARSYGGGMLIAPDAVPDDGLLDVIVIEGVGKLELIRQFPKLFSGTHVGHPRVRSFRVESLRIEAVPQDVTIDGELIGRTPAAVTRADCRVRVRVPAGW
jgi:YegS/Rv2252/BmrU family lipid kinase